MPWCEDCSKYWAPSAMTPEGDCPTCDRSLDAPAAEVTATTTTTRGHPWHFKLLIVAAVAYLVWRFYQLFFG